MDPMRTVMSADGEIAGELIFVIQGQHAMPCLRMTAEDGERLLLLPWSKLKLAPDLFFVNMTKEELLESGFPEIPAHSFPSREELRARRPPVIPADGPSMN